VSKEAICKRYSLDIGKRIILFTSIPYYEGVPSEEGCLSKEEHHEWLHAIYQASKEVDNAQLVVKPHPNPRDPCEDHYNVLREVGNCSNIVIAPKDSDVLDLIGACDVMITWVSTTGLEAMVMDKPVVIVNLTGREDLGAYDISATLEVHKREDIVPAIKDALDNSEVRERLISDGRKCVQDRLYIMDGKASQRIAGLIVDMIDAKNSQI
jgi:CDP-glycerol glycerophosphotransferase (TagB/SpsB family)